MTEQEYCDVEDLATLRNIDDLMRVLHCSDDPNKTRRASISANIHLMIEHVNDKIKID